MRGIKDTDMTSPGLGKKRVHRNAQQNHVQQLGFCFTCAWCKKRKEGPIGSTCKTWGYWAGSANPLCSYRCQVEWLAEQKHHQYSKLATRGPRWTEANDNDLIRMWQQGYSTREIAERLVPQRSQQSVQCRLNQILV